MSIRRGPRGYYAECGGVVGCTEEGKPRKTRKLAESSARADGFSVRGGVAWCSSCLDAFVSDVELKLNFGNAGPMDAR